jgi:hypothetical protein
MPIYATALSKIYISSTAQDSEPANAAAYQGLTWVEIGRTENLGTFGDTSAEITESLIDEGRVYKVKGPRNAGTMELICAIDYADAGQLAAIAAETTEDNYGFKVLFNDAPAGGTPSERYFIAIVGGAAEQLDAADSVMKLNVSLWINSKITRVAAAEGS